MLQAKEGGETSCAEVYGFSLFPSAVLLWAGLCPPDGVFPLVKRSFYLVYHSFC